jgi:thiamine kinase-like enzyme
MVVEGIGCGPYRATGGGDVGELNDILERLCASLGPLSDAPVELGGGITNRNFRVKLGGEEYVVRRAGKDTELLGIDREAERIATAAAARLGVAPAVAAAFEDCLVTRFIACEEIAAGTVPEHAEELGRILHSVHTSGTELPCSFRVTTLLRDYAAVVARRSGALPAAYERIAAYAAEIEAAIPAQPARPCHNDLLSGNIIRASDGGRLMLVDWEYAGMGDPRFDLGNLSINNGFDDSDDERLLRSYHGTPPSDARRAALKLARVLSDAREGAWGVVQRDVSELDFDFDGYAREHFERIEATVAEQPFREWLAAAGGSDGAPA